MEHNKFDWTKNQKWMNVMNESFQWDNPNTNIGKAIAKICRTSGAGKFNNPQSSLFMSGSTATYVFAHRNEWGDAVHHAIPIKFHRLLNEIFNQVPGRVTNKTCLATAEKKHRMEIKIKGMMHAARSTECMPHCCESVSVQFANSFWIYVFIRLHARRLLRCRRHSLHS